MPLAPIEKKNVNVVGTYFYYNGVGDRDSSTTVTRGDKF